MKNNMTVLTIFVPRKILSPSNSSGSFDSSCHGPEQSSQSVLTRCPRMRDTFNQGTPSGLNVFLRLISQIAFIFAPRNL